MTPTSTNGVVGYLVTALSTTGFSYVAIFSVNNISASLFWQAAGIK